MTKKGVTVKLPWKEKMPSRRKLQEQEMWELIDIMRCHKPEEQEYKNAFESYKELHKLEMEESKIRAYKWGRLVDVGGTLLLSGLVMTHEYWSPITSSWKQSITHPFNHNNNNLLT